MTLGDKVKEYTEKLNHQGLLRFRRVSEPFDSQYLHFDSNDYLSLARNSDLLQAYQEGYSLYSSGSGASALLSGYHPAHKALERAFSQLLAVDDCVLFSSGYAANLAVTALLGQINAYCLIDKGIHASIYDGLRLSKVNYSRFIHNDRVNLGQKLNQANNSPAIITEGIFSMSGQIAPLSAIYSLGAPYKAELIVDEAHSFGVLGEHGKGAVMFHGLSQKEVPLRIIPFGKSFAAQGAIVAGQQEWINGLVQAGRSLIYSTNISPALSHGLLKTLDVVINADDRRLKLKHLIQQFKECVTVSPLNWEISDTPIQQLQLGCPHLALHYSSELKKAGISCFAVRAPTVTTRATGLRVILNYRHQPEDIEQLFKNLHLIYENSSY